MKKTMYLVKYSQGDWEDSLYISIFVTESLEIAKIIAKGSMNYCQNGKIFGII